MQLPAPSQINQFSSYRPPCSKCSAATMLARIEPTGEPGYDNRTFECPACGNIESAVLKF